MDDDDDDDLHSPVLHHWGSIPAISSPIASLVIPTNLALNSIQHIRGFRSLGTFRLPEIKASDPFGLHHYLTSIIADRSGQAPTGSSDTEIIDRVLDRLHSTSFPPRAVSVQLYSISVLSNTTEALFSGGPVPAWRWSKPESIYGRVSGFWETDVSEAIVHGEWNAGRDLHLLVLGVSEERKEELMQRRVKFPAQGSAGDLSNV